MHSTVQETATCGPLGGGIASITWFPPFFCEEISKIHPFPAHRRKEIPRRIVSISLSSPLPPPPRIRENVKTNVANVKVKNATANMRWFPQPKKLPQKIRRDQSDQFLGGKPELKRASRSCVPNGKEKTHPLLFPSFSIRGGCKRRRRKKFPPVPCISNEPAEGCSFGLCPIKKDLFFYCVCGKGGGDTRFCPLLTMYENSELSRNSQWCPWKKEEEDRGGGVKKPFLFS